MKIQLLVPTIRQKDFTLIETMNISSSAVFANQNGVCGIEYFKLDNGIIKMVSTDTIGVGINRNIAFANSETDCEIVVFLDDDFILEDNYIEIIEDAFLRRPDADVIIFNRDIIKNGIVAEAGDRKNTRVRIHNCLKYGACSLAAKKDSLLKKRICFSTIFGGGCIYGSGEDNLFIIDCIRNGLHVYSTREKLGKCIQDTSTWFTGFNEKFFYDKGAWIACAFHKTSLLLMFYFSIRFNKSSDLSLKRCFNCMNEGRKGYKKLKAFKK